MLEDGSSELRALQLPHSSSVLDLTQILGRNSLAGGRDSGRGMMVQRALGYHTPSGLLAYVLSVTDLGQNEQFYLAMRPAGSQLGPSVWLR